MTYSPTLARFAQADPIGYADGPNLYSFVGDNPQKRLDPSGLYLVAFDGTLKSWDSYSGVRIFVNAYMGTADYHRGVGFGHKGIPFSDLAGMAFGAFAKEEVDSAYEKLATHYSDHPEDRNIDIVGYSRGGFQALMLAKRINDEGIPNTATKAAGWFGFTCYSEYFYPRIRFLGLVDAVSQFGAIESLQGWPSMVPPNVDNYAYAVSTSRGAVWVEHLIFPQIVPADPQNTSIYVIPYEGTHAELGDDWDVELPYEQTAWGRLMNAARSAGVPIHPSNHYSF